MMRCIFVLLLALLSTQVWAEEALYPGLQLAEAPINRSDMDSIKRGAKFFSTTCITCHTLIYLRYDKIAQEAGITYERMPINVTTWPFGVRPPDLSLEADVRGVDWIYTYLHSFYQDSTRPTGVNNLVFPNTAMSNMVGPYQGEQVLATKVTPDLLGHVRWYDLVILNRQGSMTPEQFDATITDLVNFLAYAAAPYHNEQVKIGWWVLGFLVILFVLMFMLKHEYWKDVKKHKRD